MSRSGGATQDADGQASMHMSSDALPARAHRLPGPCLWQPLLPSVCESEHGTDFEESWPARSISTEGTDADTPAALDFDVRGWTTWRRRGCSGGIEQLALVRTARVRVYRRCACAGPSCHPCETLPNGACPSEHEKEFE